jgi:hypothetical protein
MNLREIQRITLPTLPGTNEKDQQKTNQQLILCIQSLFKRDEDKERRIRELERKAV